MTDDRLKLWLTFLSTAIISGVVAIAGIFVNFEYQSGQLAMQESKNRHELRQAYLEKVLENDKEVARILNFLVVVEKDEDLKNWAKVELGKVETKIKTKEDLYNTTVQTVRALVNEKHPGDEDNQFNKAFWNLYKFDLIPVESKEVANLMVDIGRILRNCKSAEDCEKSKLEALGFKLAIQIRSEINPPKPDKAKE